MARSGVRATTGAADQALARVLKARDQQHGGFMASNTASKVLRGALAEEDDTDDKDTGGDGDEDPGQLVAGNPRARRANGQGRSGSMKMYRKRMSVDDDEDELKADDDEGDSEDMDEEGVNVGEGIDHDQDRDNDSMDALQKHMPGAPRTGPNQTRLPAPRTGPSTGPSTGPVKKARLMAVAPVVTLSSQDQMMVNLAEYHARASSGLSLREIRTIIRETSDSAARRQAQDILAAAYRDAAGSAGYRGR